VTRLNGRDLRSLVTLIKGTASCKVYFQRLLGRGRYHFSINPERISMKTLDYVVKHNFSAGQTFCYLSCLPLFFAYSQAIGRSDHLKTRFVLRVSISRVVREKAEPHKGKRP